MCVGGGFTFLGAGNVRLFCCCIFLFFALSFLAGNDRKSRVFFTDFRSIMQRLLCDRVAFSWLGLKKWKVPMRFIESPKMCIFLWFFPGTIVFDDRWVMSYRLDLVLLGFIRI